jgi:hypothetical protein
MRVGGGGFGRFVNRRHAELDYSCLFEAFMSPIACRTLVLPLLVAGLACASTTPAPGRTDDAGQPDRAMDRPRDAPASEATPAGETAGETGSEVEPAPCDASEERPPATRDTPPGEAPRLTPLPDAGYLLDDDFQTGRAPGWEIRAGDGGDASVAAWSVILGTSGSVFAQGILDPTTWHIAYAKAALGPDQIIEVRLRVVDFYARAASSVAAVFGRYDPASDSGYFLALRGDGSAIIRKRDHGISASWGASAQAGVRSGTWYTVRLEVMGSTINAFVDGVPVYSVTDDAPLPGGGVALGTIGATMEVDRVSAGQL